MMRDVETAAEWIETVQDGLHALPIPEANHDYAYGAYKIAHWWPQRNLKGAALFQDDVTDEMLNDWLGRQVNFEHNKRQVIGNIRRLAKTTNGIEGVIEYDREQASLQNVDLKHLEKGGVLANVSFELTRDPQKSEYLFHDDKSKIFARMPSDEAIRAGHRRTTLRDPYRYNGWIVTERCVPARFTGLGITSNPADRGANLYKMTASDSETPTILSDIGNKDAETADAGASVPASNESLHVQLSSALGLQSQAIPIVNPGLNALGRPLILSNKTLAEL